MILADLHIHVGRSLDNRAVKITASSQLTLPAIIRTARDIKGLNLIGIVDSHSDGVREDYRILIEQGDIRPLEGGGYMAGSLVILPGMEAEVQIGSGHAHLLAYFPTIRQLDELMKEIKPYVKNSQLSSQKVHIPAEDWIGMVGQFSGIWLPAHAFTPHKGIYGCCCTRIGDILPNKPLALEMGLSADRAMAESIGELKGAVLLSNSDAHSSGNIAREYNQIELCDISFSGLVSLLQGKGGRLHRNYGLPPEMGKYHRSYCPSCLHITANEPPVYKCSECGNENLVMGVMDRVVQIADIPPIPGKRNPDYIYRVPLSRLPGIGPKKYSLLLQRYGTELAVYHQAEYENLKSLIGEKPAQMLLKAINGEISYSTGGGGIYGKVLDIV